MVAMNTLMKEGLKQYVKIYFKKQFLANKSVLSILNVSMTEFAGLGFAKFGFTRVGINASSGTVLSWGKNSAKHLFKHGDVLNLLVVDSLHVKIKNMLLPIYEKTCIKLFEKMELKAIGEWNKIYDCKFFSGEGKMLVTRSNGEFLTVINKTSNHWYNLAWKLK